MIAQCESEAPSVDLYTYTGKIELGNTSLPLDVNQLLLKGAVLKNTEWCIGFCVYSGHETRVLKNSLGGKIKRSNLETQLNTLVREILIIQIILCLSLALMGYLRNKSGSLETRVYIPF